MGKDAPRRGYRCGTVSTPFDDSSAETRPRRSCSAHGQRNPGCFDFRVTRSLGYSAFRLADQSRAEARRLPAESSQVSVTSIAYHALPPIMAGPVRSDPCHGLTPSRHIISFTTSMVMG